jgi:glycine/D-amino acid oxidase-like deaminating enzyme/nitrite reductase/ring-hydroxylating ferredoxin subunit
MVQSKSAWQSTGMPKFEKLSRDMKCDVLVIGGGMTGLTTAYLLTRAGKKVCLLERDTLASGDTGCTTAHLTYVTDERLSALAKHFGKHTAALVWQAGAAAIQTIEHISRREEIDCEFRRVPGFLHASLESDSDERRQLGQDAKLAREFGFEATLIESAPIVSRTAVRFANVAKFHPIKYLGGVAHAATAGGCKIFEHSEAMEFSDKPRGVKVNGKQVTCDWIVLATHVPLMGKTGLLNATIFQTKLYPYSSYVVGAKIPKGKFSEASFWDTTDPYYYLRIDRGASSDYAIFGGQDHKTGQVEDTEKRYQKLERMLLKLIPTAKVDRRWSGQVIETNDGLPYIGETADRQFAATGFSGTGMTFGTLGGMMACDAILRKENPWKDILSVNRKKIRGGTWDYVTENVDYPYYLLRDRLKGSEARSPRDVKRGEGKVVLADGQRVACSRDEDGKLTTVSAICTHMGCVVHWNSAETSWDCPCHGSRFKPTGEVIGGPAEKPLEQVKIPATQKSKSASAKPTGSKTANKKAPNGKPPSGRTEKPARLRSAAAK